MADVHRKGRFLGAHLHDQRGRFRYGSFVNALPSRLRAEPLVAEETRKCPECLSEIPIAARRCAFSTTHVAMAS
jgi:hypothetical protein